MERQIGDSWSVGVRGIYRSLRRVIEDTCESLGSTIGGRQAGGDRRSGGGL